MRQVPLSVFLHWPAPNYINPTTRGAALLVINIIFIILVTLSIAIRLYSRIRVKRQGGMDDIMIVLAYIFTIGMTAVVLLANRNYGWNRHMWDVEVGMVEHANIIAFVAKLMFTFASCFTRMSLIFLYYRLVKDTRLRWYNITLHISLAFNIAILISFTLIATFMCIPVEAYWKFPDVIDGKCMNEGAATLWVGIVSCCADFLCTTLPIPVVLRLRMPLRQRIGVCVLMSAGIVVTVAGIVRTWFIYESLIATYDETWFTYPLWICAALEIDIAVICACVPDMKTVLWKPFRIWTISMYSNFTSSSHGSRTHDRHTGSQDPIVDSGFMGNTGYQLNAIDIERTPHHGRKEDHKVLERAIAQLPGANHNRHARHAHHTPYDKVAKSAKASDEHIQHLLPAVYIPSHSLGINKETTFQITEADAPRQQPQRRIEAVPRSRTPYRPRHLPLMPLYQQESVTPRVWDEIYYSRHNAPAGLPPTSPAPERVSQNTTAPLTPISPMSPPSMYSTDVDSRISVASKKKKKKKKSHGGTSFHT